jgi:PAS domain S-box-containing protein
MLKAQLIAQEKTEIALASEEEIRQNLEELHAIQEKLIATQEEERKSNEVFKALFDYSTNPHLLFDETGIIDCNNATLSLLGYSSKNDLLKLHPAKLSPEKQNDGSLSSEKAIEMDKIAREKGYHRFEWTHHKADNTDFPVEVTLNPIKLGNKEVLLVVWNDLTERKQAELRIQQQNEKLLDSAEELRQNLEELNATQEALQNNSLKLEGQLKAIDNAIGYVEFTPDRKIATANKLFCNLLGYNEDEIKTLLHSDFLPKEYANSESYQEFWNTLLQGQSFTQEFERINKQGNTVWLYASYAPIVNKKGEVVRIIKLASDITERKQIDEKVKVQNDDLIAKNKEIAESHQKLKASEEEIRQNMEELVSTQEQLQAQYDLLAIKSKNISDSINYAQRIQTALLPRLEEIQSIFPDSFLLFRPRDVISGDFYWFANKTEENTQIIVAADCTGHGVPGAFMSMLGSSLLSNIVHDREIHEPNKILDLLHDNVEIMLNQRQEDSTNRDGMDASICVIDRNTNLIKYAGANNSLYIISQNPLNFVEKDETEAKITIIESENWQLTELKADKKSIGGRVIKKDNLNYNLQELQLNQELRIYLSSDGFIDQIGGAYRKKLMSKNFKQLLIENHQKPYEEQKTFFNTFFENWISDTEKQLDDVMVLGIKIIK